MSQTNASINVKLIESLAQIILSLTDEERQILGQKVQYPSLSGEQLQNKREVLQRDIAIGMEQLKNGEYAEYDDSTLPNLLETIKMRGKQRLEQEKSE